MVPTFEAQALIVYCQTVKELEGVTLAQLQKSGEKTSIKLQVSGPTSIMRSRAIPNSIDLLKKYPHLYMTYDISDRTGTELLKTGQSQFVIVPATEVVLEMDSKILKPEEYVLVGAYDWKNRAIKSIIETEKIIDFNEDDQMTFDYLKKYKLYSSANKQRIFVNNNESLAQLFEEGVGYGVLTKEFAQEYLKDRKICILNEGLTLENRLALAWYPRPNPPRYFEAFIKAMK